MKKTALLEKISSFPRSPGAYLFRDAGGKVLYVGKAKRLRDRVKSYFVAGRDCRPQIAFLLHRTADVDCIVTDTEKEALLLENTLIKEHRPRYNVSLRDDKGYVSIRIDAAHPFPGITLTRRVRKDGALYFGPHDSGYAAREAVEAITRTIRLRTCADVEFANRVRPCLKHDIGRCTAPCVGRVSGDDYARQVEEARLFLSGQSRELIRRLEARMQAASGDLRYEEAARLRDAIAQLRGVVERQKVVRHGGGDHDAVGLAAIGPARAICVLSVRGGALLAKRAWVVTGSAGGEEKIVEEFLLARYGEGGDIPPALFLSHRPEAAVAIADIVARRRGGSVALKIPRRGEMLRLVELAVTNARETLMRRAGAADESAILERLGKRFGIAGAPERIECVDISNTGGREAVGSLVAFVGGTPDPSSYRLYTIRTLATPDDYAMLHEVLARRFRVDVKADTRGMVRLNRPLPDLLLVDGGKGQLSVAQRVLEELGLTLPIAAIAKGEKKGRADQIFIPNRKNPLPLKRGSKELLFLMRIRDEAHRFGIKAHRRRREKQTLSK